MINTSIVVEDEELMKGALYNIGLMTTLCTNTSTAEEMHAVLVDIQHTVMLVSAIIESKCVVYQ